MAGQVVVRRMAFPDILQLLGRFLPYLLAVLEWVGFGPVANRQLNPK